MKTHGDIPPHHLAIMEELEELEEFFRSHKEDLPPTDIAKGMVCIAHDWYEMYMEEEGERLLKAAEKYSPGYFKLPILIHAERDWQYALLVRQLTETIGLKTMIALGFTE